MNDYTFDDALAFVSSQSPGSTHEFACKLATHLLNIMEETGEPAERAWIIKEYWKDFD